MGLQLPSALTEPLGWIDMTWPEGDEDELFEAGQRWIAFGTALRGTIQGADKTAGDVWSQNQGEAVDALRRWWTASDGPHDRLEDDALAAETIGAALIVYAGVTLALKIQFLVQLAFLAAAVARALAAAAPTLGASLAEIPPTIAKTQGQCQTLTRTAVNQIQTVIKQMLERAKGLLKRVEKAAPAGALGPGVLPMMEQIKAAQGFDAKLVDDVKKVNPNFSWATPAYSANCVHVAQALELRRRGEDVEAAALPRAYWLPPVGKYHTEIEREWGRRFTPIRNKTDIDAVFKAAGDGARGIVRIEWNGFPPVGHVFNVENVRGTIRYLDGQVARPDVAGYFAVGKNTSYLRTDDLPSPRNVDRFSTPRLGSLL